MPRLHPRDLCSGKGRPFSASAPKDGETLPRWSSPTYRTLSDGVGHAQVVSLGPAERFQRASSFRRSWSASLTRATPGQEIGLRLAILQVQVRGWRSCCTVFEVWRRGLDKTAANDASGRHTEKSWMDSACFTSPCGGHSVIPQSVGKAPTPFMSGQGPGSPRAFAVGTAKLHRMRK